MEHFSHAQRVFSEEIAALESVVSQLESSFDAAVNLCLACEGKIVVVGIGKSGIVGHKIAATLASTGSPSIFVSAAEALHGDMGVIAGKDVVLLLSHSGRTPELLRMLPSIRRIGAKRIGILGDRESPLAKEMDVVLSVVIEKEACPLNLAPMTSSTVALVTGDALAAALMEARGFSPDDFAVFHPGGTLGRRLLYRVADVMHLRENLPVVRPDQTLDEAVHLLGEGRLGAVMVVDDADHLLGILVEGDVRRHYLKRTPPETPMHEAMTPEPKTIGPEETLGTALDLMEKGNRQVYVLPVVDEASRLLGLLRMHDIVGQS